VSAPASRADAPTRVLTAPFALVLGATFAVFSAIGLLLVALPLYVRDELHRSDLAVGIVMGAASIGAIVAGPIAGRIADRRGRRIVVLVSIALMFGGYLFLAAEPPLAAIIPVRLVVGAAEAAFVVAAYTMATDLTPSDRQGEGMSLITVGSYLGLALGPLAGDLAVGDGRFPLAWLIAAAAVVVAAGLALGARETRPVFDESPPAGWLPPRSALLPGLVLLLALIGFGGFNAFAVLHAREVGLERPGLVFLLFAAVVILVRVAGRRLPDRLGPQAAASFACAAVAAGLVVVAAWQNEAGLFLGTAVFAVGQAFAYPAISLLAMARSSPAERSAAVGAVIAFVDVALATGAFVLGIAAEVAGYPAVFVAGALSAGAGLALLTLVAGRATAATRPA
jgi:MFS family permease